MSKPLKIWNKQMLLLMDDAMAQGKVKTQGEWCKRVGVLHGNLVHIKSGDRSFTIEQILKAADLMNKPMDWFFGRTVKLSATDMIREGLRILEAKK